MKEWIKEKFASKQIQLQPSLSLHVYVTMDTTSHWSDLPVENGREGKM